jgi:hypothetical protein
MFILFCNSGFNKDKMYSPKSLKEGYTVYLKAYLNMAKASQVSSIFCCYLKGYMLGKYKSP